MTSDSIALSVRGVAKAYGDATAIEHVDLDVRAGELVTLLGPSGSGKTTLLMAIAGFAEPDAGSITLDGRDITTLAPHRRGIGVVFQQYALFPHLTIAENVAYPLRVRRMPRAQRDAAVDDALKLVKLERLASRRPAQLSGGQQQRVALARALVFKPPVLLMDEPLGALDRKLRMEMQLEIRNIQRTLGITTVYVTHDQEEALVMSDRIAVMHLGRIEQIDTPERIYRQPASAFVANFLGESNVLTGRIETGPDGVAQFHGDALTFPLNGHALRAQSAACTAVIRPEDVVCAQQASRTCPHRGTVRQVVYLGASARLHIALANGSDIIAVVSPKTIPTLRSDNDSIWFGWQPDDAALVPAS